MYINRIIGEIFCQVDRIKHLIHVILFIRLINQLWKGAAPNLIKIEILIIKIIMLLKLNILINCEFEDKINIDDEKAWIIKYLIVKFL